MTAKHIHDAIAGMEGKHHVIRFTCYGKPQPQGSSRAFVPKGWSRPIVTSANPNLKSWRQELSGAFLEATSGIETPIYAAHVPVEITLRFYFSRPKSVKRAAMTVAPDADKLVRSVLDSGTGICWVDDAQVIEFHCRKMYGGPERCEIEICEAIS